jgi:RND superfamily putative drug exporter
VSTSAAPHGSRRLWVWPLLVVVLWLVIGGPLLVFAGKLTEVRTNDNAEFLPRSAESTEVLDLSAKFFGQDSVPAIVVFEAAEELSPQDLSALSDRVAQVQEVDGVLSPIPAPIPAKDGLAAQVVVPIDSELGDSLPEVIADVRAELADLPPGVTAYVTGPAGVLGDFVEAFGAIDGLLLAVALVVVLVILLVVYRSPILPLVVLLSAVLALGVASAVTYALAKNDVLTLNGQSQGILSILVVGAATDYALLLVARYREELREQDSKYAAMRTAYRGAVEPIVASAATVILGLLCLLLSSLTSTQGLGPVGALGVAGALLASLTFLPALLLLLGRGAFWPFRPTLGSEHPEVRGIWGRISELVGRRTRAVWVVTVAVLAVATAFAPGFRDEGVAQSDIFLTEVESVTGQQVLGKHFPSGSGDPAYLVGPADQLRQLAREAQQTPGVVSVVPVTDGPPSPTAPPKVVNDQVMLQATLSDPADSLAAEETVAVLRAALDTVTSDALVGGTTAIQLDTQQTSAQDRNRIIPTILLVIFLVLALLLRSVVAPLVLIVANVLSFGATLGVSALVFNHVFGFPGGDPTVTLIAFVFLVALGIDYSIFLMTRVREESLRIGTRPGVRKGLSVTGGVITSAGVVLAATFSALGVLPILFLAQIAFLVAFGVLLDTFVVRSLLVPALCYDIGPRVWWPGALSRRSPDEPQPVDSRAPVASK